MKYKNNQTTFLNPITLLTGLMAILFLGLNSCRKEDSTHQECKDKDKKEDYKENEEDTTGYYKTCKGYLKAYISDIEVTDGETFKSDPYLTLKVIGTGSNGCAKSVRFVEKRIANSSYVDIYLTAEVLYEGCICTCALVDMPGYFKLLREKGTATRTYRIHYQDASTDTPKMKYFYY